MNKLKRIDRFIVLNGPIIFTVLGVIVGLLIYPYIYDDKYDFERIAQRVADANGYNATDNNYVCHHFTIDLVNNLTEAGYNARYVLGERLGQAHVWTEVCLYIESVNGDLLKPSIYNKLYVEK